jgi:hypothetical protein
MAAVCRSVAVALTLQAGTAAAQSLNRDVSDDGATFRNEAIFAIPNPKTPVPDSNLLATAPGAERQVPSPRVTVNVLSPFYVNFNADSANSGRKTAVEGSPVIRISGAGQLGNLPLRLSGSVYLESDRFDRASDADFDKIRPQLQLQYVNSENDQAWSPFASFNSNFDFHPTYARRFETEHDLSLGISKAFNFDGNFRRVAPSGNSSASTAWSLGFTALIQRRFRDPEPSSYALEVIPSLSRVLSEQWQFAFGLMLRRRWYDAQAGTSRRDLTMEPVVVLEYDLPEAWFGGERTARWFGRPALDFVVGYERNWSNESGGTFGQWIGGVGLKTGWRF